MTEQEIKGILRALNATKQDEFIKEMTNSSVFEDNVSNLLNVDIYKGVKELIDYTNDGDIKKAESAYINSGIKYISERIKHYLIDTKIAQNVLVEYSLLSSTLNPERPGKLQCCSFVIGSKKFKNKVDKVYTHCIEETEKKKKISIYQHPHFLYNIQLNTGGRFQNMDLDVDDNTTTLAFTNGKGITTTIKKNNSSVEKKSSLYDKARGDYYIKLSNQEGGNFKEYKKLYLEAFELDRPFAKMLLGAKKFKVKKGQRMVDVQNCLHSFCHKNITCSQSLNKKSYNSSSIYVSFPIYGSRASNQLKQYSIKENALQGIGACFLYIEPTKNDKLHNEENFYNFLNSVIEKIAYETGKFIRFIASNYSFNLGLQLQENARKETIKSAVSAIMSRNMSHNLGSHYLYYTKAHLDNLAKDADDNGPDIRGAAKVLGYIQARMDYLATVISNDKYPYGAVNFKSQIYDELTIDDFSSRHFHDKRKERTTNFLLTNLILSENFSRPNVLTGEMQNLELGKLFLNVKYSQDGVKYEKFTGTGVSLRDIIKPLNTIRKIKDLLKEKESINKDDEETIFKLLNSGKIPVPVGTISKKSILDYLDSYSKDNIDNLPTMEDELDIKNALSSLNISLPGGTMSCHAFFNLVENFIRNSAKYSRNDFNKKEGLVCTIAIRPHVNKKGNKAGDFVDIIIYDNKQNAIPVYSEENRKKNIQSVSLYDLILEKLGTLKIINNDNQIAKENKGFKEMLFSAIWMRAYTFGDETYADIVTKINQDVSISEKLSLIEKYGFSLVKVEDTGEVVNVFDRLNKFEKKCNLGIMITLPKFNTFQDFKLSDNVNNDVNNMLNTMADVVRVDSHFMSSDYNHVFTRPLCSPVNLKDILSDKSLEYKEFLKAVQKRFPEINNYYLCLGDKSESAYNNIDTTNDKKIYFQRHLNLKENPAQFMDYAYADSISGGDFTVTLSDLFSNGLDSCSEYNSPSDKLFALRIKESALTRITIIDERLHKSSINRFPWLALKNIRVLNHNLVDEKLSDAIKIIDNRENGWEESYINKFQEAIYYVFEICGSNQDNKINAVTNKIKEYVTSILSGRKKDSKLSDEEKKNIGYAVASYISDINNISAKMIFEGNSFRDNLDRSHFLTIHLGLLEKILKNSIIINYEIDQRMIKQGKKTLDWSKGDRLDSSRVIEFMRMLREQFDDGSKTLYIAVHSGRGNYSAELEGPLARFPFISLSALESAFNNSKYQLSQLLYNTVYIGKGFANHLKKEL